MSNLSIVEVIHEHLKEQTSTTVNEISNNNEDIPFQVWFQNRRAKFRKQERLNQQKGGGGGGSDGMPPSPISTTVADSTTNNNCQAVGGLGVGGPVNGVSIGKECKDKTNMQLMQQQQQHSPDSNKSNMTSHNG